VAHIVSFSVNAQYVLIQQSNMMQNSLLCSCTA